MNKNRFSNYMYMYLLHGYMYTPDHSKHRITRAFCPIQIDLELSRFYCNTSLSHLLLCSSSTHLTALPPATFSPAQSCPAFQTLLPQHIPAPTQGGAHPPQPCPPPFSPKLSPGLYPPHHSKHIPSSSKAQPYSNPCPSQSPTLLSLTTNPAIPTYPFL